MSDWVPAKTALELTVMPLVKELSGVVKNYHIANNVYRIALEDGRQFHVTWGEIECRFDEKRRMEAIVEIEQYDPITFKSTKYHAKHLFHDEYETNEWPSNIFFLEGHLFSGNTVHIIDKVIDTYVYFHNNQMIRFKKSSENFTGEEIVDIAQQAGHADIDDSLTNEWIADLISIHRACFKAIKSYRVNELKIGMPADSIYHDEIEV